MEEKGVVHLLTAKNKHGKLICIGDFKGKEELQKIRKESFYCPQCQEKLVFKLGTHRISHFAHSKSSACSEAYER